MGDQRTTTTHFRIFKKEARLWLLRLGLQDWRVDFEHQDAPDHIVSRAWYHGKVEDRVCALALARSWGGDIPTNSNVRESAFHEVCHVLLADIEGIASGRNFDGNYLDKCMHQVIRRLEKLFYGSGEN